MKRFKIITAVIAIIIVVWIWTRPDIFHPFSSHTAYEREYYMATGYWTKGELYNAFNDHLEKELDSLRHVRNELKREVDSILKSNHNDSLETNK